MSREKLGMVSQCLNIQWFFLLSNNKVSSLLFHPCSVGPEKLQEVSAWRSSQRCLARWGSVQKSGTAWSPSFCQSFWVCTLNIKVKKKKSLKEVKCENHWSGWINRFHKTNAEYLWFLEACESEFLGCCQLCGPLAVLLTGAETQCYQAFDLHSTGI